MHEEVERRREIGAFLRARRTTLDRAVYALPRVARSRTTGLRREEVAALAGVSVTWYAWLEQGRDINASRQVLDALARVLSLTPAEHDYLLSLSGFAPPPASAAGSPAADSPSSPAPAHIQRLLDSLSYPAFAVASDWRIAAWNVFYSRLYPRIEQVGPGDRNLLWLIFTDPYLRDMLPDWAETSGHFLGEFRAESGSRLGSDAHTSLIRRLSAASPEFADRWADRTVERFASRRRVFVHPLLGELVFEHNRLVPSDHPELHLVLYLPVAGTETAARLGAQE